MSNKKVKAIKQPKQSQNPSINLEMNQQEISALMQILQVAMSGGSLDLVDSISHFKNKITQSVSELNKAAQG